MGLLVQKMNIRQLRMDKDYLIEQIQGVSINFLEVNQIQIKMNHMENK